MRKLFNRIFDFLSPKMICGKTFINESMTAKYGADWLDQCVDGLKNSEVRKQLKEDLKL